jgi:uncharacterized protein YndB with AHSA1/START domain
VEVPVPDSINRDLELPVDLHALWRAVTDPAALTTWLADEVAWDLEPGGEARFVVEGEVRHGWVEEARAPQDGEAWLAFWWQADGEPASRVFLGLAETATGTRLVVCENRPLEILDVVGIPLPGTGDARRGPAMVHA